MTGDARFCPQCGTQRAGFFRFCWKCGFDYDEFLPPEARRAADPRQPAPTKSTLARPGIVRPKAAPPAPAPGSTPPPPVAAPTPAAAPPAVAKPPVAVPVRPATPRVAQPAARPQSPAAAVATAPPPAAAPAAPVAPPKPAAPPRPAVWPPPGAMPAEDLERKAPVPTQFTPTLTTDGLARRPAAAQPMVSPAVAPTPATRVEPARPSTVRRRPDLTLTRIAIVVLAALLAFSAVSNFVRSNSAASRSPGPTTGLETPITAESPGAPVESPDVAVEPVFRPAGPTQFATVTSVVDGDTIKVDIEGTEFSLRYIGVDSPEPDATDPDIKRLADAATAANASLVEGRDVYLEREVSDTDRFGRLLRDVWLVDSGGSHILISIELVRSGYAQIATFPPDVRYLSQLTAAQTMAQEDRVGLWGLDAPPAPAQESPVAPPGAPEASPQDLVGGGAAEKCHASYDPCLPIVDDLDCAEVRAMGAAPVTVKGPDDYMLDPEEDGLGCESDE